MKPNRSGMITVFGASFLLVTILCCFYLPGFAPAKDRDGTVQETVYYIVREGDTLWSISDRFYHDPFLWPFVWGSNPGIANPHWIYPGDPILLAEMGARLARPGLDFPRTEPEPVRVLEDVSTLVIPRSMADTAVIRQDTQAPLGWVLTSADGRTLMSQGDDLFLEMPGNQAVFVGERFQLVRSIREIRHPNSRERLGTLVRLVGYVETAGPPEAGVVPARVLNSNMGIEAGDRVVRGAMFPAGGFYSKPALRDLDGSIVASLRDTTAIAQHDVCFVDRGVADGVEVGDSFWVIRPGREVKGFGDRRKVRTADARIGSLVILHAEKQISTALVTKSDAPFLVGSPVRSWTE